MSRTKVYNADSVATYDSSKVEVVANKFQLKLKNNTDQLFEQDFSNDTGFAYEISKAEFSGGRLEQKDTSPLDSILYSSYNNDVNLNWGNGTLIGNPVGGASVILGDLDLTYNDLRYVDYNADNLSDVSRILCWRFRWKPNYSGSPVSAIVPICLSNTTGSNNGLTAIAHQITGNIRLNVWDENGTPLNIDFGVWSPVLGTEYEFEINCNLNSGATRLFVNGNQFGPTDTQTSNRSVTPTYFRIGSNATLSLMSNVKIGDILFFSTIQHTTDYTPDWGNIFEYKYVNSSISYPNFNYTGTGAIQAFTNIVAVESGLNTFIVNNLYYNSGWISSDGTIGQSSSIADILLNIATLPPSDNVNIIMWFDNSNYQGYIDNLSITYTGQIYPTDNPIITFTDIIRLDGLLGFEELSTIMGSDEIKHIQSQDAQDKWHTTGWGNSDGTYIESNLSIVIENNKETFITENINYALKTFLHSETGSTTPSIESITIKYDFAPPELEEISTTILWFNSAQTDTEPDTENAILYLEKDSVKYGSKNIVRRERYSISPDEEGVYEISIADTESMELDENGNEQKYILVIGLKIYKLRIPLSNVQNSGVVNLFDNGVIVGQS